MGWGLRIAAGGLALVVGAAALAGYAVTWAQGAVTAPGPLTAPAAVVIPRGGGTETIAMTLWQAGVIDNPLLFTAATKFHGPRRDLKAGEFVFPAGVSVAGALDLLRQGKPVVHKLTVPEGLTSQQVAGLLTASPLLSGIIDGRPAEGSLLPETYHFSYGESRAALLSRMKAAMDQALADAWKSRAADLPLRTPAEALVLASVVEKETGVAAERPRVAGVFVNRLRTGMRLQSDPTVIYALTNGETDFTRPLTRADLKVDSPYNTYVTGGLPPGPIANPGRAALVAATQPEKHEFVYFVADGTGGHAFAKSLSDHNRNVTRWREGQRANGAPDPSPE
ncbi:UPF0755 protein [Azospirillum fermentarium]|uniref:endolytic transglycosylase MltG n=1 Tax=Azospirillum fermentarium TaxID=1233114 RepID=UPI002225CF65|nr:endolytic transglycosylase MltG [Azospirillum fermentarium]MCW2246278.1 UPF0755 protein [Azospirillum fermentarium]